MTLSVIIPAYNESKRISKTIRNVVDFLRANNISFEIIVVPNNCSDNTEEVVRKIQQEDVKELKIVTIMEKGITGNTKGLAISAGMKESVGDYSIFIDADNATLFSDITKFISCVKDGYDVVIASRYVSGANIIKKQPLIRILLSRVSNFVIRLLLLPGIYDTQCGFKLFSKEATKAIFQNTTVEGWGIDLEILALARYFGFKIKEFPVVWESQDESSVRSNAVLYTFKELLKIRNNIKSNFYKKNN